MREGVGGPVSDEHSSFLDRVLGSTRHLNTLIDDILFFVQLEADRVLVRSERVRTDKILEQVLSMIPHPDPEQVRVPGEGDQLERAQHDVGLVSQPRYQDAVEPLF